MSPDETSALMAYLAGVDPRFTTSDADQAATRVQVWADLLSDVGAQFALDFCRRYYDSHHDWPVQAGAIKTGWRNHVRAEEAKNAHRALMAREPAVEDEVTRDARLAARERMLQALEEHPAPVARRTPLQIPRPVADKVFVGGHGE